MKNNNLQDSIPQIINILIEPLITLEELQELTNYSIPYIAKISGIKETTIYNYTRPLNKSKKFPANSIDMEMWNENIFIELNKHNLSTPKIDLYKKQLKNNVALAKDYYDNNQLIAEESTAVYGYRQFNKKVYNFDLHGDYKKKLNNFNEFGTINLPIFENCDFVLISNQELLEPSIEFGDYIALKELPFASLIYGQQYIIVLAEYSMLGTIIPSQSSKSIILKSSNSQLPIQEIQTDSVLNFLIIKKIIKVQSLI
jgi:hypothetical protein